MMPANSSGRHISFVIESAYGHIVPTLGIAAELRRRGHRVSYALKHQFASKIRAFGCEVIAYRPLENKLRFMRENSVYRGLSEDALAAWRTLRLEEEKDTLAQLEPLYRRGRPDLIVYDITNPTGRVLVGELNVPAAEHSPIVINQFNDSWTYDNNLVVVTIPHFFQREAASLEERFQFVGFIQNDRTRFFDPWIRRHSNLRVILVYATTGLLEQTHFFKSVLAALQSLNDPLVLCVGDVTILDSLGPLPASCEVNRSSANFEILQSASLVVGQAGTGSTLEALYWGVPQLLIPPPLEIFEDCASRVAELGLGVCLKEADATVERIGSAARWLLNDAVIADRLAETSRIMHATAGATLAVDLLEKRLCNA
jgi:UDP:flavonoid glycosyltransferase YjiC (YdhE family)